MEVDESALNEIDAMYSSDEDKKKKKKGKKQNKKETVNTQDESKDNGHEQQLDDKEVQPQQQQSTVLSAAQKKKLKKERSKLNKAQIKKEETSHEQSKQDNVSDAKLDGGSTSQGDDKFSKDEVKESDAIGDDDTTDKKDDKKKKKKKKGAAVEEPKEKVKESARSKHVAKIKENLLKKKEEEERLRREEEERIKREEEAERLRLEEEQKEKERKERKKQKEKEKKQRLKAEGKLLTEKEKQNRRRVQELVAMRGIDLNSEINVEDTEKKKKPRYEKLKKRNRQDKPVETEDKEISDVIDTIPKTVNESVKRENPPVIENNDDEEDDWEKLADDDGDSTSIPNSTIKNLALIEGKAEAGASSEADSESTNEENENGKEARNEVDDRDDESESEDDDDDDEDDDEDDDDDDDDDDQDPLEKARERIRARHVIFEEKRSPDKLRAPVVCVLGHVDTGKTKILDKLRRTHVQDGEAGGITQQIGATNVPSSAILDATKMCKEFQKGGLRLPGLLIIDTPGHESFSNLRSRGSSLCDIAILVVDIMHGLEPQTIESIQLLLKRKTPFIVALNKIDRLFQWRTNPTSDVLNTLKKQQTNALQEFNERVQNVIAQFAVQELNACLFNDNNDLDEYISMIPTSAHTGDGMGNLLAYLCDFAQKRLTKRLAFSEELEATVMEVKEITGLGTTIDVILVNGKLHENSHIIIAGQDRPIVTQVRGLLMPQPMKELRVKNAYSNFKEVEGAQGVKIIAKDLEKALAGLPLFSSENQFEQEVYCEEVSRGLSNILRGIQVSEKGVYVQASTLGSLEALLEFLRTSKIPYASINIGPVHRRDVMKASVMLDRDPQWAVILAFDVKVERDAQEMAESLGVRIFTADIIYHLFDRFMQYRDELKRANQDKYKSLAVFPVKLRVLPQFIFNSRDPIVCGVAVDAGILREGTPIIVPSKNMVEIGRITSIESNKKPLQEAKKGQEVCIKISPLPGDTPKLYGRHFDHTDMLVSKITRESIDAVKDYFRDDLTKDDWKLMVELKKVLGVS